MTKRRGWLWVTDPWSTLDHPRDTSLRLAKTAAARGIACFWADATTVELEAGQVTLEAREILAPGKEGVSLGAPARRDPAEFAQVHYRVDPPVDLHYVHPLQLLELAGAALVNPARALLGLNEKTACLQAGGPFAPRTLVSAREGSLLSFLAREKQAVLKPLHEAQSKGIHRLSASDLAGARLHLQEATQGFARPALLQQFLPGISAGETRLWFVDGELLACARKLPLAGDFRVQIDQGSLVQATELEPREQKAAAWAAALLRRERIRLAAVDLIEGLITDFNLTSPGLIVQMEEALDRDLATPIVRRLARSTTPATRAKSPKRKASSRPSKPRSRRR